MADLYRKVDELTYDKLIADTDPQPKVAHGIITKLGTAATYTRGTILARSSGSGGDGKLKILGTTAGTNETLTADCILAEDVDVGTSADAVAVVYVKGAFNSAELKVKTAYTITQDDLDALKERGCYTAAQPVA